MNAQTNSIGSTQPLLERSKKWLMTNPGLLDVKKALSAIVAKVAKGDIADDDDSRDTYDALTEHYVDGGGDLSDPFLTFQSVTACDLARHLQVLLGLIMGTCTPIR
jgi:hypothetical protein